MRRSKLGAVGVLSLLSLLLAVSGVMAASADQEAVLARIGTRVITLKEFEDRLRGIPDAVRARLMTPEGLKTYLKGMVLKEAFSQEASRLGLEKTPEVQKRLEESRREILFGAYTEKVTGELTVTESDLTAYYEAHRAEFGGKPLSEVRGQVAEKVREAKLKPLWERAEQEAFKRWKVTMNEALLNQVKIDPEQGRKEAEQKVKELERRLGPLPEEQKRILRGEGAQPVPLKKP